MGLQDSPWNISVSSLVILAASVLGDIVRTNRQADTQTNAVENLTPATSVCMGNIKQTKQTDNKTNKIKSQDGYIVFGAEACRLHAVDRGNGNG